jgi:hypothetical protein
MIKSLSVQVKAIGTRVGKGGASVPLSLRLLNSLSSFAGQLYPSAFVQVTDFAQLQLEWTWNQFGVEAERDHQLLYCRFAQNADFQRVSKP